MYTIFKHIIGLHQDGQAPLDPSPLLDSMPTEPLRYQILIGILIGGGGIHLQSQGQTHQCRALRDIS